MSLAARLSFPLCGAFLLIHFSRLRRQTFAKAFKTTPDDLDMHVIYGQSLLSLLSLFAALLAVS